jgi:hypothetical protein
LDTSHEAAGRGLRIEEFIVFGVGGAWVTDSTIFGSIAVLLTEKRFATGCI